MIRSVRRQESSEENDEVGPVYTNVSLNNYETLEE